MEQLIMKLYFFKSVFDNVVDPNCVLDLTWSEMLEVFSEHVIAETKHSVMLFNTSSFSGDTRTASCVSAVSQMCLDFDSGVSIEQVKEQATGLRYLGYTSYGHLKDGTTEKFRLIVPFVDVCPITEWNRRKHDVLNLFPQVDPSTITVSRIFYMPSCPADRKHLARFWSSEGELFNWRALAQKPEPILPTPIDRSALVTEGAGQVVYESFDAVQFMKDQGLYRKQTGVGKHDVTCPNIHHLDGGTVIWQDGKTWPSFYCSHHKCAGFDFYQHWKEKLGAGWMKPYCARKPELSLNNLTSLLKNQTKLVLKRKQ
jgi:hypothetical protein